MRAGDRRFSGSAQISRTSVIHQGSPVDAAAPRTAANLWMNRSDMWKAPAGDAGAFGADVWGNIGPRPIGHSHYHPQRDPMQAF